MFYITHSAHVRDIAITIPGDETDKLGDKAKKYNCYICGAALAVDNARRVAEILRRSFKPEEAKHS